MATGIKILIGLLCAILSYCANEAGMKIAIKKDVILEFEKKFLPRLVGQLGNIKVPNQYTQIKIAGNTKIQIWLSEIVLSIRNLLAENIQVSFHEPNIIKVNAHGISGGGSFKLRSKLLFFDETSYVTIRIKKLNTIGEATLIMQESPQEKGKFLPSGQISSLNIDFDFDFDISGQVIAKAATLIKNFIKKIIKEFGMSKITEAIRNEVSKEIPKIINYVPIYVPLEEGLVLDYSILSPPKVVGEYLILNSSGAIFHSGIPESKNPPISVPTNLPDFDPNGKIFQLFLSDYSVNYALNSLFLSNKLDKVISAEEVPKDSPVQLNTSSLESVISGITDVYGKDKPCKAESKIIEKPKIWTENKNLNVTLEAEFFIFVQKDDGEYDRAIRFKSSISASGEFHVQSQGKFTAQIYYIRLKNSKMIESKVPDADIYEIELMANTATKIVIPMLNNGLLKNISIKLPVIEGISFKDSTVEIKDKYTEMNVTPVDEKVSVFTELIGEQLEKSFLAYLEN